MAGREKDADRLCASGYEKRMEKKEQEMH